VLSNQFDCCDHADSLIECMMMKLELISVKRTLVFVVAALSLADDFASAKAAPVQFGSDLYNLVTDTNVKTEPTVPKPSYLGSYTDPLFGTKVTRITGDVGTAIPNIPGSTWGNISRAGYETRPAWNADQSILLLEYGDPAHTNLFLNGNTYQPLFEKTPPGNEFRWDPIQANMMDYVRNGAVSNTTEFGLWNVMTGVRTVQLTIPGYTNCNMSGDGNWSSDGSMAAVYGTRVSDGKQVVFAANLSTGTKYPDIDLAAQGMSVSDGVISISPKGDLIVLNGTVGSNTDYTRVFNLQGNPVVSFSQYGLPSHYDLSVDANGNEVAVGVAKTASSGVPYGVVVMRDLQTGTITPLDTGKYSVIVSTRNQDLPGWAFVNNTGSTNPSPYTDEIDVMKLDGSKTVARLASAHNYSVDYNNQGFVVPSPDGLRFVFSSDWGNTSGRPVQTYVVDLRGLLVVPGDFNHDGFVDTADYIVWRSGLGTTYTQADYDAWRANFGQGSGSGTALSFGEAQSSAVPEPTSICLLGLAIGFISCFREKRLR
jgi:hypothetical protein